jgi:pimeloyl-ACP methyl ester carboxylesterase
VSFILAGDSTVYYEEYGAGESLVLIPGLLGTIESDWRRFIPEFSRHHHTIAVDLRGHGRTNNPQRSLSLEQLVRDLRNLCDTLEIQRPFFCTHGVAAHIPLAYIRKHPASVGGILLHAPVLIGDAIESHQAAEELTRHAQPDDLRRRHEGAESDDSLQALFAAVTALVGECGRDRTADELRWNAAPALITGGENMQGAAIARLRQLAAVSPRVSLEILPASGALPGTIQKLPFVTVVSAFVNRAANERSGLELDAESSS